MWFSRSSAQVAVAVKERLRDLRIASGSMRTKDWQTIYKQRTNSDIS